MLRRSLNERRPNNTCKNVYGGNMALSLSSGVHASALIFPRSINNLNPRTYSKGSNSRTLTTQLFFDSYEKGADVRAHTDQTGVMIALQGKGNTLIAELPGERNRL